MKDRVRKKEKEKFVGSLLFLFLVLFIISYLLYTSYSSTLYSSNNNVKKNISNNVFIRSGGGAERVVSMLLPAVLQNNTGVYARADMYYLPGKGNVFLNVENTLYGASTEHSIRKAIRVAGNISGVSTNDKDFYVDIYSDAIMLNGPSAGAAFTLMALALLEGKRINKSVMITGTIDYNGDIGPSGKILEKARAAKEAGAKLFLVPKYLSFEENISSEEKCEIWGGKKFCDNELKVQYINISKVVGINVREVGNIQSAEKYVLY